MNSVVKPANVSEDWTDVCVASLLTPDVGICVLFKGEQVAIFYERKSDKLYAISNYDPIGKANVLSRGIVGSLGDKLVVASPLYKQHFCLNTGKCLEEDVKIKTYSVRIHDGKVQLN